MRTKRNALAFHISLVGRKNLSREIYRQIVAAILDGRLKAGDRLSPTRELARTLAVSRMTVTVAYEQLAGEGYASCRQGAGTFVSEGIETRAPSPERRESHGALQARPIWDSIELSTPFARPARFDFRVGIPDPELFPHRQWQRALIRELASHETALGKYGDTAGYPELRKAIARQIGFSRGVKTTEDGIVITNGTQGAIDLLARTLLEPGDAVAVEDPGYPPVTRLLRSLGLRVIGVPVDESGIKVEELPREARAAYVTPSHQFPLGVTMTLQRRQALLEWAGRNNAAIFEDDYDSEFRFAGRPCESLQALDTEGRVIYVGSFSKTLFPALRVGFVVAPASLLPALSKAKFVSDWHSSTIAQAGIARFMREGDFARHIRRMTRVYRERRALVEAIIGRDFSDHLDLVPSSAGLHVAALAKVATADGISRIAKRASDLKVEIQTLSRFAVGANARSGIALGYGGIPTERIEEGLRLLLAGFDDASA